MTYLQPLKYPDRINYTDCLLCSPFPVKSFLPPWVNLILSNYLLVNLPKLPAKNRLGLCVPIKQGKTGKLLFFSHRNKTKSFPICEKIKIQKFLFAILSLITYCQLPDSRYNVYQNTQLAQLFISL